MKEFLLSLLFLGLLNLIPATARTHHLTRFQAAQDYILSDTAYVDDMEHIDNQADSVVVSGHTFKGPGPFTVHFEAEMSRKPDYFAWEIAEDNKFQMLIDRFRTLEYDSLTSRLDYEFSEQGSARSAQSHHPRFTIGQQPGLQGEVPVTPHLRNVDL